MKKYISTIILAVTIIFGAAHGQDTLTLQSCRDQAIEYNKQLKIAEYQKGEADAYRKMARTSYLPSLSAEASVMHLEKDINITIPAGAYMATAYTEEAAAAGDFTGVAYAPEMELLNIDNLSLINGGISITQPIYTGGKIRYANKKSQLGVEMAQNSFNMKYDEVVELTDKAFWQVATIEANIKLAESYIEMLTELQDQMTRMYELGLTPKSENLKVNVQKNDAELNLLKAQNGLKIAKMYLNQVIGRDLTSEVFITYDLIEVSFSDRSNGTQQALENRSELKLMQGQVKMAEYDKKIALADYLPSFGVSAKYSTFYLNELYEDGGFSPMIAAKISIPIFSWGQGVHKQHAAEFAIRQKQEDLSRTTELISLEVMQVKTQLEESFQQIILVEKNIAEAEESLAETKSSFDAGLNTTTELLNAEANLQNAKSQLIMAKAKYKLLETSWQKVTGTLAR